ncbi:leucine-rich repeat-containing protein 47-like [Microplitis mediator]|uniref:leucine-rich repeat-containing protein 47-like n=1 Tax=Microplitis mediator TaxID=375433 RepID=UPI0025542FD1|nr:leucine-rich repeat-containing protein 47-like [Microplitis mediator]XP_057331608.1 leucine-rich repeat-containing protein 47-like [Microplitis mediator]
MSVDNNWNEIEQVKKEKRHELILSGASISEKIKSFGLSDELFNCETLNYLNISHTCLQFISEEIGRLTNLTTLVLHSNQLQNIPVTVKNLTKLKILDCSSNELTLVPDEITLLTQLTTLNLNSNLLSKVPCLKANVKLNTLDLSNNKFDVFPDVCYNDLSLLAEIKISKNSIREIPDAISVLPSLKHFDVADNCIKAVPGELADCQKLKELNLKGNKLNDKRLEKLIDQCRTKQILDYVNQHCEKSSKSKGSSGKENKGKSKKNTKNDGHNKNIDDDAIDNLTHKLKITHVSNESPVIKITESIKQVRPHIVGCIVRNISFNEENFKKFIQLQTKLHDGICDKRNAATIATHDYDLIVPGDLTFTAKAPTEIEIKPLGRTKLFTAAELFKRLQVEADNLRREKKRNVYSGIYKYLYLIEGKPLFPCLLDSANQVISFPPITNSDITKMSVNTKNMFIEVTGVTSQQICRNVMDEFLKELITQGLCSSTDSNQTSNAHNLEVEQVKVVDMEGNLKHIYPSRVDLNFDDKIKIIRD